MKRHDVQDVMDSEAASSQKPKKQGRKIVLLIGVLCVLGLMTYGVFYVKGLLDVKAKKTITVDGIVLTDRNSPENRILFNGSEGVSADIWQNYSDTEKVKEQINKRINSLQNAFKAKNVNKIAGFFTKAEREYYKGVFSENKENLDTFTNIFSSLEIVYLSPPVNPKTDTFDRIAEYKANWNEMEFSIVFIQEDGQWCILEL